jgi:hypothetical protein
LLAVIAWGASYIATKVARRELSPITVMWLRFTMGVVIRGGLGYFALLGWAVLNERPCRDQVVGIGLAPLCGPCPGNHRGTMALDDPRGPAASRLAW